MKLLILVEGITRQKPNFNIKKAQPEAINNQEAVKCRNYLEPGCAEKTNFSDPADFPTAAEQKQPPLCEISHHNK